jgi:hypothetical protein
VASIVYSAPGFVEKQEAGLQPASKFTQVVAMTCFCQVWEVSVRMWKSFLQFELSKESTIASFVDSPQGCVNK